MQGRSIGVLGSCSLPDSVFSSRLVSTCGAFFTHNDFIPTRLYKASKPFTFTEHYHIMTTPLVDSPQPASRNLSMDDTSQTKHTSFSRQSTTTTNTKKGKRKTTNSFDEIIPHPSEVKCRNLVLCFDGTGDQFDDDVSFIPSLSCLQNPPANLLRLLS